MFGYVLQKPKGLPSTRWACKTVVNDYDWHNRSVANQIEFSLCTASSRTVCQEGRAPFEVKGTTFGCVIGEIAMHSFAETGVEVEIASVAVRFPSLFYETRELLPADFEDPSVLLLPVLLCPSDPKELLAFDRLLSRYIQSYVDQDAASEMQGYSIVFELLARLDAQTRRQAREITAKKDKYIHYYVMKADAILRQSFSKRITLQAIAAELGITPSYLSAIYRRAMGVSFSERLCALRMERAKELLTSTALSVSSIAEQVGFCDESNLRKSFKQYFGMGLREYRNIAREQTLYHAKPIRKGGEDMDDGKDL